MALLAGATPAQAGPTVTVSRVSGMSPFADGACLSRIDTALSQDKHGLEVQPAFAWSPRGPVAAWVQDSSVGIVTAHRDATSAWSQVVPPALSLCQPGGAALRLTWPTLAVDGAGTTILAATSDIPDVRSPITTSRSADGGATWSRPTTVSLPVEGPADFVTLSADPKNPHAVAIAWNTVIPSLTWFARSTDDGKSWSVALPIHVAQPGTVNLPNLVTLPDGTLVVVIWNDPFTNGEGIDVTKCGATLPDPIPCRTPISALRSTDHGATWTESPIVTLPDLNWMVDSTNVPPQPVVGPDGSVNVLIPFDHGATRAWKIWSSPDGRHWSDTGITVPLGRDVFPHSIAPSLAITSQGVIGVMYADHRLDDQPGQQCTDGEECRTDQWLTESVNRGATWRMVHLGGPFDLNKVPGHWLGDIEDLHAIGPDFGAIFALGACEPRVSGCDAGATDGATDIFFARVARRHHRRRPHRHPPAHAASRHVTDPPDHP